MSPLKNISPTLRDLLIEHIDGPVSLASSSDATLGGKRARSLRNQNLRNAMNAGLIELRDQKTAMTEKGREALCKMLAHWADVLASAGFEVTAAPFMSGRQDPLVDALIDSGSPKK